MLSLHKRRELRQHNLPAHTDTTTPIEHSYAESYPTVHRTFAFIDVAGYTKYTKKHGTHAAAANLHAFRNIIRDVVGRHGVRVGKWLGDGVMLVGVTAMPVVEVVTELSILCNSGDFRIHAGIAKGEAIIFEGDDYVGEVINIASRLCDLSKPGQVLSYNITRMDVPRSIKIIKGSSAVHLRDLGELQKIYVLQR